MASSPVSAARGQYLLDLLAQIPEPRKRRGRRHPLAGVLAVRIAAVVAGSRSFAVIGQWATDAGDQVLEALGATRGAPEESTLGRAFAALDAGRLDAVLGAWLWTRAVQVSGRLVIAVDGKTVRGAKAETGRRRIWSRPWHTGPVRCWGRSRPRPNRTRSPPFGTCCGPLRT